MEAIAKCIVIVVVIARKSIIMAAVDVIVAVKIAKKTKEFIKAFAVAIKTEVTVGLYSCVMVATASIKEITTTKLGVRSAEEQQFVVVAKVTGLIE